MASEEMLVESHHKLQYASSVQMVAQQNKNPLDATVTEVPASGEAQSVVDLIDAAEYQRGSHNSRRNPENPIGKSRRWVVLPEPIESGQYITKKEKFATAMDPTSNYVTAHTKAVMRGKFDTILGITRRNSGLYVVEHGGILGVAREGKTPGTGSALPASQYIPHNNEGLTLEKLREARKALKKAEFGIEDDDQLFGLITPEQEDDLIGIAQEAKESLNAFNIEQLKSGKATPILGISWIVTNRLPFKADGGPRLCPIWSKKNLILGRWQGIEGKMWNDTHAKNLPYVLVDAYYDAVRAEDKGVVVIECMEPPAP
ncbi:MAG: phage capsid protein [Paracoccus sp. (in: a-proteobacteria)]|uniref:phage capsid protein n=1 Tax=Paracoccus sp. TaxID=267 RepID=UPI00405A30B8